MIQKMSEEFYNKLYNLPPGPADLQQFAEQVLNNFIEELQKNTQGVNWNSGFDGVIFVDKAVENNKSLRQIKEEFLGRESDDSDSDIAQGTGTPGHSLEHQEAGELDKFSESATWPIQEQ